MKRQLRNYFLAAAVLGFLGGAASNLSSQERFDHKVRNDFFAGFNGDTAALERGMKATAEAIAANPNHAEALVWHGSGLFFQSQFHFQKGDQAKGMELYGQGIGEMKKAVALEPKNIGVRIPRGAVLLTAARFFPPPMAQALREDGLSDYLASYELQKDKLEQMGTHPRGELLFGIADAYSRNGNVEKASEFFALIQKVMPEASPYAKRAAKWNETKQPLPAAQASCIGCHTPGK